MKTCIITLALLLSAPLALALGPDQRENPPADKTPSFETQLIFFAVLEGLYTSGIDAQNLKQMLPNPDTMTDTNQLDRTNFIYACPICMPTFDALRLYASRNAFYGQKGTRYKTFGPGLDAETQKALHGDAKTRREAIRSLIDQWVRGRLDRMALTDPERAEIDANLEKMRKQGKQVLQSFQDRPNDFYGKIYAGWDRCAACDGACAIE